MALSMKSLCPEKKIRIIINHDQSCWIMTAEQLEPVCTVQAAVKEARREARHAKKQLKELYKGESQLAQKLAAVSGPSSIHLM